MKPEKFLAFFFVGVIILIMISVPAKSVIYRVNKILEPEESSSEKININWEELYPFESSADNAPPPITEQNTYSSLKEKLETRTSKGLLNYYNFVETAKLYEELINWDIAYITGYNPVVKLSDGYFTTFVRKRDVSNDAAAIIELSEYCNNLGIEFCYINVPHKVCMYEDADISGILDFSNQNTNNFLELLRKNNIKYCDLRKILHDEGMSHHESFFVTDHHWKPETGLWAAGKILGFLKNNYNWDTNPDILKPENFERVIYPEWFLGSQGCKVTLSRAVPDDISLLYPKYKTLIKFEIPSQALNVSGDFTVNYDMSRLVPKDYYKLNCHSTYNHGSGPVVKYENLLTCCDKKILFIRESFSNTCMPFLAMGIKHIEALDMRHFTGSARSYIKSSKPDLVVAMYNSTVPGVLEKNDPSDGAGICDFR